MNRTSSSEERILQAMIDAARSQKSPGVDSRLLEAQLRQKWLAQRSEAAQHRFVKVHWLVTAAAALALVVGAIASYRSHTEPRPVAASQQTPATVDGDTLALGAMVVADASPLSVAHSGRARWVLSPHSAVRVTSLRPCLTLDLEQGRIDADVVPKQAIETFAVETRTHRVAVHGTQFSVTLEPSGTLVEVSSGTVVVSAIGKTPESMRLTAPQRVRFPQDAPPAATQAAINELAQRAASAGSPKGSNKVKGLDGRVTADAAEGKPELPLSPPAIEQETALDFVRAAAARCFVQQHAAAAHAESNVLVRLETQLTITLAPAGNVQEVSFAPPVPQAILTCTFNETRAWTSSPSRAGATATRAIILTK